MNTTSLIPGLLLCLLATGCVAPQPVLPDAMAPVADPYANISLHSYPYLEAVPGLPVYYASRLERNYFFYDGLYWVYERDHWYASDWYSGPWITVRVEYVPVFLLRVPVRYYRLPPPYFHAWHRHEPPRWGEHWGPDWERRHPGWRQWTPRDVPAAAPLPDYQRAYRGRLYPGPERQRELHRQHYRYQPRERVELQRPVKEAPREAWQQDVRGQQREWRGKWRRSAPGQESREVAAPGERQGPSRPDPHVEEGWTSPPASRIGATPRLPVPAGPAGITPLPRDLPQRRERPPAQARQPGSDAVAPARQRDARPSMREREPVGAPFSRERQRDTAPLAGERQQDAAPAVKAPSRDAVRERLQEARDRVSDKEEEQQKRSEEQGEERR